MYNKITSTLRYDDCHVQDKELKLLEEQLAQTAEEKYRMLFDSIDQGFFLIDVLFDENDKPNDIYYVEANKAATNMLGIDFTGKRLRDINSNYEDYWFEIFGNVALTGQSIRMEQFAEPDKKWYSFYIFKTGDKNSRRIGNIFLDITSRKKSEETLKESEQLYRTLFENTNDGFVLVEPIIDESGHSDNYLMVKANQAWAKQTGLNPDEFIGKTIKESMPGVELIWSETFSNVIKSGESKHFDSYDKIRNKWYDSFAFKYKERLVGVLFHDISDRKKIEEELRESEKRLRALTMASTNVVYCMSPDWRSMTELKGNGFLTDSFEPNTNWDAKHIHPDDREYVTGVIHECIREKKMFELEHRVLQADGSIGWTYSRAIPMLDEKGEIKEWFGSASDITVRKRTEEALRKSEEHLRMAINAARIVIWDADLLTWKSTGFDALKDLFGVYPPNDMTGALNIYHPDDRARVLEEFSRAVEKGGEYQTEWRMPTKEGDLQMLTIGKVVKDNNGQAVRALGVIQDITERKRVAEALRNSEERMRALVNSIPDEVWYANEDRIVTLVNPAVLREFGDSSHGDSVEKIASSFEVYRSDGSPRPIEEAPPLRALNGEVLKNQEEIVRTPRMDQLRYRQVNASPVIDAGGNIIGSVSVVRDITEQKQAEEALHKSEEKYRVLFNSMGEGFAISDVIYDDAGNPIDFRYIEINKSYEEHTGLMANDIIGKTLLEISPDMESSWIAMLANVAITGQPEKHIGYNQSTKRYYETLCFSPGKGRVAVILKDITKQKQNEIALSESEENYRTLFNSMDQGFCIIEEVETEPGELSNFRYILANPAFEKITGLKGIVGKTILELVPNAKRSNMQIYDDVLKTGEAVRFEAYTALDIWVAEYVFKIDYPNCKRIAVFIRDITKLKQSEVAQRESEHKFRTIIETSWEGILMAKPQGNYLYVNQRFADMLGYTADELLGNSSMDLSYEQEHEQVKQARKGLQKGELLQGEFKFRRKDGTVLWTMYNATSVFSDDGEHLYNIVMHTDITERKRAEESQRESERKYRDLFRSIDEGFCIIEVLFDDKDLPLDYRFLEVNPAFERQTGLVEAESRCMRDLAPGHEQRWFDIYGRIALTGEPARFQDSAQALGRFFDVYAFRVGKPEQRRVAIIFVDISKRKQADEALRESEGRLRALTVASTSVVYRVSPDWSSMTELYGKGFLSDTQEPNENWLDKYIHPYDQEYVTGMINECIRERKTFELEHRVLRVDGSIGWTYSRAVPLPGDRGKIKEWIGMANDITERKRAEEALRKSEKRANELVKVLEEADKNKNQFISVLSHELRNPLAAITVGLSVLEVSVDKQQIESIKDVIKRQVNQLCKLVDELLDLTRITQNKIKLKRESIQFNKIVRDAVYDIKPEFDKKGVQIWEKIQTQPISLYADPIRITQCIGNLLYNAIKFTPVNGNVWVSLENEKDEAVLTVQDNGIGISPVILTKLFKPFTQADETLDRYDNNGLGLGLSIVKGIVELHDGKVEATSEGLGKGALFTIRLPISAGIIEKRDNASIKNLQKGYRIMIIEDNKDLAELLCSVFTIMGHEAYAAYNGLDGIGKAREIQPDIIFCDIGLPGKNGYEVARIIREDSKLKNVYLIALTGYAGEHDIEQAMKSGFDRHLTKPIDMDILKRVLSENIERQQVPPHQ